MRFLHLTGRELWGGFGAVLVHGIGLRRGQTPREKLLDRTAPLLLYRTGPFIPPVTFPHSASIVVSDEFRSVLHASHLGCYRFKAVIKEHIVPSRWHTWNWTADEPEELPDGAPDEYLSPPHCPVTAEEMGDVWEIIMEKGASLDTDVKRAPWDYDLRVHASSWDGSELFYAEKDDRSIGQWPIVTETGRDRLAPLVGEWVTFEETLVW